MAQEKGTETPQKRGVRTTKDTLVAKTEKVATNVEGVKMMMSLVSESLPKTKKTSETI